MYLIKYTLQKLKRLMKMTETTLNALIDHNDNGEEFLKLNKIKIQNNVFNANQKNPKIKKKLQY